MAQFQDEFNEEFENQCINEEYLIWNKNVPYLYDKVITHELEWPSLSVQWLPVKDHNSDKEYAIHKLIMGTHTSEAEPNYLLITKVRLPQEDDDGSEVKQQTNSEKITIETKILHEGEVNRARYMPQKYNVIATKTSSGDVLIFDYTQHPTKPEGTQVKPQLRLKGHQGDGFGLSWNEGKPGHLVSGGFDNKICIWDIEQASQITSELKPYMEISHHQAPVEDVCWHKFDPEIFGSVSDDHTVALWDTRNKNTTPIHSYLAHSRDIYSIDFNPFDANLFLTGSADKSVALWDIRNLGKKLISFEAHSEDVLKVEWSTFSMGVFASASFDRRIIIWDLSRVQDEQAQQSESNQTPSEQLFIHGGHRSKIQDFNWNPNDKLVIASLEEDNILQVWQMGQNIYYDNKHEMIEEKI